MAEYTNIIHNSLTVDGREVFQRDIARLNAQLEAERETVDRLKSALEEARSQVSELYDQIDHLQDSSAVGILEQELQNFKSTAQQSLSEFRSFLESVNLNDAYGHNDDQFQRLFQRIENGSITAGQAIMQVKTDFRSLMEENYNAGGGLFDAQQVQTITATLSRLSETVDGVVVSLRRIEEEGVKTSGGSGGGNLVDAFNQIGTAAETMSDKAAASISGISEMVKAISDFANLDTAKLLGVSQAFGHIADIGNSSFSSKSVENVVYLAKQLSALSNSGTSSIRFDFSGLENFKVSSTIHHLSDFLNSTTADHFTNLERLSKLDFSNLANLKVGKAGVDNLSNFSETLQRLNQTISDVLSSAESASGRVEHIAQFHNGLLESINAVRTAIESVRAAVETETEAIHRSSQVAEENAAVRRSEAEAARAQAELELETTRNTTHAYQELIRIQDQIGRTQIRMVKLDGNTDAQQIERLRTAIQHLREEYDNLYRHTENSLSEAQRVTLESHGNEVADRVRAAVAAMNDEATSGDKLNEALTRVLNTLRSVNAEQIRLQKTDGGTETAYYQSLTSLGGRLDGLLDGSRSAAEIISVLKQLKLEYAETLRYIDEFKAGVTNGFADAAKAVKDYYAVLRALNNNSAARNDVVLTDGGWVSRSGAFTELANALNQTKTAYDLLTSSENRANMAAEDQVKLNRLIAEEAQKYNLLVETTANKQAEAERKKADAAEETARKQAEEYAKLSSSETFDLLEAKLESARTKMEALSSNTLRMGENFRQLQNDLAVLSSPEASLEQKQAAYQHFNDTLKALEAQIRAVSDAERENAKAAKENADSKKNDNREAARKQKQLSQAEALLQRVTKAQQEWTKAQNNPATKENYKSIVDLIPQIQDLIAKYRNGGMSAEEFAAKLATLTTSFNKNATAIKSNGDATKSWLGTGLSTLKSRLAYTFGLANIVMKTIAEIKKMVSAATELDAAMNQLQIVTKGSNSDMAAYAKQVSQMAKATGQATKDLIDATTVYARLGYTMDESAVLAKYTAMLQGVGDIEASAAQDAMTAIIKAFGKNVNEVESVMDKLVTVGNNFPISVSQLAEGMNNAGSMLAVAGNSMEQSIALLTAANTTTQDISKASTGLRTIAARIRKTTTELDDLGEAINESKYEEMLQALAGQGVSLTTAEGEYRSTYEVLQDIARVWDHLSSMDQAAIIEALAGTRQQNVFSSLITQFREAEDAIDAMTDSSGALEEAYSVRMESIEAHIATMKAAFDELSVTFIDSDLYKGLIDFLTKVIEGLTSLLSHTNAVRTVFEQLIGIFVAAKVGRLVKGIIEVSKVIGGTLIGPATTRLGTLAASLGTKLSVAASGATTFGAALKGILSTTSIVTAAIVALTSAIAIYRAVQRKAAERRAEAAADATADANEYAETTQQNYDDAEDYIKRIRELKAKIGSGELSTTELYNAERELLSIQDELTEKYGIQARNLNLLSVSADTAADSIRGMRDALTEAAAVEFITEHEIDYRNAAREMEKVRTYSSEDNAFLIRNSDLDMVKSRHAEVFKAVNKLLQDNGVRLDSSSYAGWSRYIYEGTAREAAEVFPELRNEIDRLGRYYGVNLDELFFTDGSFGDMFNMWFNDAKSIIDEYADVYDKWLEADIARTPEYRSLLNQYEEVGRQLAEAVTGEMETPEARKAAIEGVRGLYEEARSALEETVFPENDQRVADYFTELFDVQAEEIESAISNIEDAMRPRRKIAEIEADIAANRARIVDDPYIADILAYSEDEEVLSQLYAAREAWLSQRDEEYAALIEELAETEAAEKAAAEAAEQTRRRQIASYRSLSDELVGATQALKAYNDEVANEHGQVADEYAKAYKQFIEDWNAGRTGSKAVEAAIELFIPDDVLQSLHYDMQAAGELLASDMYQAIYNNEESSDYGLNFANFIRENIEQLEDAGVTLTQNENGTFNFAYESARKLAYALNMSEDAVVALLDGLDKYGVQIMLSGEQTAELAHELDLVKAKGKTSADELQRVADQLAASGYKSMQLRQVLISLRDAGYLNFDIETTEGQKALDAIIAKAGDSYQAVEEAKPEIDVETSAAMQKIDNLQAKINSLHGKTVTINARLSESEQREKIEAKAAGTRNAKGGDTLVNELGPELISDNGRAYIANGGAPGFTMLGKGAIVFNAEETKRIFGRRYSDIPIRAMGTGTSGIRSGLLGGGIYPAKANVATSLTDSGGGLTKQAIQQYLKTFIQSGYITFSQAQRILNLNPKTLYEVRQWVERMHNEGVPMQATNEHVTWTKRNGKESSPSSYSSPTSATIPNLINSLKNDDSAASSASSFSPSSSVESDPQKVDWIAVRISRIQRAVTDLQKVASSAFKKLTTRLDAAKKEIGSITEEIEVMQKAYGRYLQEAESVGLSADLAWKVREGTIDINKYDDDTRQKIQEYQEWYEKAIGAQSAIEDLHQAIAQLYLDNFNNAQTEFENRLSEIEHSANMVSQNLAMAEARGYLDSMEFYKQLTDNTEQQSSLLTQKLSELNRYFKEAMDSGEIEENSEAWYQMKQAINETEEALAEANVQLVEYQHTMRSIAWSYFDYAQDRMSQITQEANFLINLMSNDKLFSDNGQFNGRGQATVAMRAANYDAYMAQADEYAKEMARIQRELANDPYDTELIERRETLLGLQQQSIQSAEAEKNAVRDLVAEGIQLELAALQELIDAYNDSLDSAKELYDYQKKVAEQTADIASLEKQLSAYQNDTSEENIARVQKLQKQLSEARTSLSETEMDKSIEDQKKLLTELYSEYEEALNARLDNVDALMAEMINMTNENLPAIKQELDTVADDVGYTISDAMRGVLGEQFANYSGMFENVTGIHSTLTHIYDMVAAMAQASGAVKAYAKGGLVDYTGLAAVHGTPGAPEMVLSAADTAKFIEAAAMMRSVPKLSSLTGVGLMSGGAGVGTVINGLTVTIPIDHVQDYNDMIAQMQRDPKFDRLINAITTDRIAGGSGLGKFGVRI